MIREGDNFNPSAWFQKVCEERAQAKHVSSAITSGEPVDAKLNASDSRGGRVTAGPAFLTKTALVTRARTDHEAASETPETRLRRRLVKVSSAWDDFQESRARDAVYKYLGAVFEVVEHYKLRRKTKSLLRRAFKFAGVPFDKKAEGIQCRYSGNERW